MDSSDEILAGVRAETGEHAACLLDAMDAELLMELGYMAHHAEIAAGKLRAAGLPQSVIAGALTSALLGRVFPRADDD